MNAIQAAIDQVTQECGQAGFVFLDTFADSQNLPKTLRIHGAGHQQGDIAHSVGAVPPGLDSGVDLFVEIGHRARTDPSALQRFGVFFHPPHGNARQVHLDQRFLSLDGGNAQ